MRRKKGLTLIELQTAAVLMSIILVAVGVMFTTTLNAARYVQDAYTVYWNAMASMKAIRMEIMRANRYGWIRTPSTYNFNLAPYSIYGAFGYDVGCWPGNIPSLGGVLNSNEIWVRADRQPAFTGGVLRDACWATGDEMTHIFLNGTDLEVDAVTTGWNQVVASQVTSLQFFRITFHVVAVELIVQGNIVDAGSGLPLHEAVVNTVVHLRAAPGVPPEAKYAGVGLW